MDSSISKYPKRFMQDHWYMAFKEFEKDTATSEWIKTDKVTIFKGKPHNKYDFDFITDYDFKKICTMKYSWCTSYSCKKAMPIFFFTCAPYNLPCIYPNYELIGYNAEIWDSIIHRWNRGR